MNELKLLKEQNRMRQDCLNETTRAECEELYKYLEFGPISRFQRELVRKELIGMAFEAQAAGQPLGEYLGMPIETFAQDILQDMPASPRLIRAAERTVFWFFLCTVVWLMNCVTMTWPTPVNLYRVILDLSYPVVALATTLFYTPYMIRNRNHGLPLSGIVVELPVAIAVFLSFELALRAPRTVLCYINPLIPLVIYAALWLGLWWYCRRETSKLAAQTDWAA